jgi:hypothetical protein
MRSLPASTRRSQVVESLKEFLTAQSAAPDTTRLCPQCGWVLSHLSTQFWLEGGENAWDIRLPYCSHCHPLPATKETFAA